jgi:hypothetical protein
MPEISPRDETVREMARSLFEVTILEQILSLLQLLGLDHIQTSPETESVQLKMIIHVPTFKLQSTHFFRSMSFNFMRNTFTNNIEL